MLTVIESWEEVIENFQNFNASLETSDSKAKERLSRFFHWYYLPSLETFAPGKFLGYQGMTLSAYEGEGSGSESQQVLKKYFIKLERDSQEYNLLHKKLESFMKSMGKQISMKTISGTGGIYIPKSELDSKLIIDQKLLNQVTKDIDSINNENNESFVEGDKKEKLISFYERNPSLRAKAIEIHGLSCQVCNFNFEESYGSLGENYIEVHHLTPMSSLVSEKEIDPEKDLAVLCSNCHRMIHRVRNNILSPDDLKNLLNKVK
ncbi:MAG TPA: HNH endonuclease [Spirochaetota bacterium]|nr:HNH endonuclease [Spirochaetota bacterium]